MNGAAANARQEAIDWAVRAQDPSFVAWEALERWLQADPSHALLYDQVTIAVQEAAEALDRGMPQAPVVAAPLTQRRYRWVPLAMAASLVAAIGGGVWHYETPRGPALYALSTPAGARRSVQLGAAVRMELNGDTSITLDHHDDRFARLDRGQALFTVTHDPRRPFRLQSGDIVVTDIGTIFDVEQGADGTRVSVADGEVRIATATGSATVAAGHAVLIPVGAATVVQRSLDRNSIGAWRRDRIDFADVSLADLARRLHRATGATIEVAPDIAGKRVSGSIAIGADRAATLRDLGPMLGASVSPRGKGWIWSRSDGALPS